MSPWQNTHFDVFYHYLLYYLEIKLSSTSLNKFHLKSLKFII